MKYLNDLSNSQKIRIIILLLTLIPALFLLMLGALPLKNTYKRICEKEEKT